MKVAELTRLRAGQEDLLDDPLVAVLRGQLAGAGANPHVDEARSRTREIRGGQVLVHALHELRPGRPRRGGAGLV